MSIGLIFFTLADSKVRPNFNSYGRFNREFYRNKDDCSLGVIIICSALLVDAIIGNYQEEIMKTHHVSNIEMVEKIYLFLSLILNEDFFSSFIVLCLVL
jgi:adenosine 3'-phospho 5'-phosphosulfate transporter B3